MDFSSKKAFWVVRHGYAAHNAYQNRYKEGAQMFDPPLTPLGKDQARAAGEYFALLSERINDIERVVCSPSVRCRKTAEAFLKAIGREDIPIIVEPLLGERLEDNGKNKGPHKDELQERIKNVLPPIRYDFSRMAEGRWWANQPETTEEVKVRALKAINKYFGNGEEPGKTLFVTHHGFLKALTGGYDSSNVELMQISIGEDADGKMDYKGMRSHFKPKSEKAKELPRRFDP